MKAEKFIYNKQTLRYEKVKVSWKERAITSFLFVGAVLFSAFLCFIILNKLLPSPEVKMLSQELDRMKRQYNIIDEQLNLQESVLVNLQDRDAGVYRMIFGVDPVDNNMLEMGVGGADRYQNLSRLKNTSELMIATTAKLDKLRRKIAAQSESMDMITELANDREKMYASIPSIKPVREDKLNRKMVLMSGFGRRLHPIHKIVKMHQGIDFSAPRGTEIQSTGDGKVILVKNSKSGYGRHVIIDHGYGYQTLYGHMNVIEVRDGQAVKKGQRIGLIGSTGTSTAPHLHYEVHYKGKPVDPIDYCQDGLTKEEYAELVELSGQANQSFD